MNEFQERQWIEAARRGDQDAFASLVHLYEKRVMALALRMCRSPEDAAEAVLDVSSYPDIQELFLAADVLVRALVHGCGQDRIGSSSSGAGFMTTASTLSSGRTACCNAIVRARREYRSSCSRKRT